MASLAEELDTILKGDQTAVKSVDAQGLKEWATGEMAAAKTDEPKVKELRLAHMKSMVSAGVAKLKDHPTFEVTPFDPTAAKKNSDALSELGELASKLDATTDASAASSTETPVAATPAATEAAANASAATPATPAATETKTDPAPAKTEEIDKGWTVADEKDPFPGTMQDLRFDRASGQLLRRKSVQFT